MTTQFSRRFELHRTEDVSGISGTGIIADGIVFPDDTAVIRWRGDWPSMAFHDLGLGSIETIHGHGGRTKVVWLDNSEDDALLLAQAREAVSEGKLMESLKFVRYTSPSESVYAVQLDDITAKIIRELFRIGVSVYSEDYLVIGSNGKLRVAAMETFEQNYVPVEEDITPEERIRRRTWLVEYLVDDKDVIQTRRLVAKQHYNSEQGVIDHMLQNGAREVVKASPAYGVIGN